MNVFTDFHHSGLLQSLILLFEKRLGAKIYRPIGTDWHARGFWKVYDHPATVEQFLGIGGNTPDGTQKLNEVIDERTPDKIENYGAMWTGVYKCHDIDSGQTNKAVTFDAFMRGKFDIVIASLPAHVEPFKRLCKLHPSHPKLIYQIGNSWTSEAATAPNIMASAVIHNIPSTVNFISYHQEFSKDIFHPPVYHDPYGAAELGLNDYDFDTLPDKNIYSFVNCFDVESNFKSDYQLFTQIEQSMPDWSFKIYGGQCRDGAIGPSAVLADMMRQARFIWHTKSGGDGYGHVIHNAPATGKPLIVKKQYYQGKMAESLLKDGETCIVIDGLSPTEIIEKITYYSEPTRYKNMSKAAFDQFNNVVDFDAEQKKIEEFLSKLL